MFTGLCYVCGVKCYRTYCHEHKWAAKQLGLPDRKDQPDQGPRVQDLYRLMGVIEERDATISELQSQLAQRDKLLDAWRSRATVTPIRKAA